MLSQNGAEIVDAEVVVEDEGKTDGSETSNEPSKDQPDPDSREHAKSQERPALPKEEN
jgi:hypothetical protein